MRLLLFFFALSITGFVMATEEPKYTVLEESGDFELRVYEPKIIAETSVSGSMDEASSKGFRVIADYIFGNNTSKDGNTEKISMTSPVSMAPLTKDGHVKKKDSSSKDSFSKESAEKISMTAPVNIKNSDQDQWLVHFVMPSEYSLDTLPEPNNDAVKLLQVPASRYAVIRFSGFAGEEKVASKTATLMKWLNSKNIKAKGKPELARYNPPWTLPFLRRNEVMVAY